METLIACNWMLLVKKVLTALASVICIGSCDMFYQSTICIRSIDLLPNIAVGELINKVLSRYYVSFTALTVMN